jgi:Zn-dependent protease with chaperone function
MVNRAWLFGLLLGVPLVGMAVAEGIRWHLTNELRSAFRAQIPEATEQELAQVTLDRICEQPHPELRELCATNGTLKLMRGAALGSGVVGLVLLLLIRVAGQLARDNRKLLVVLFGPGLRLTAITLIVLVLVHAAVAIGAIYFGESILIGRVHFGIIAAIGVGAVVGVVAMARHTFQLVRKAQATVIGNALTREQAPELWARIDDTAQRLGALQPDHVVVGLDPSFFVTEADVTCLSGELQGRTLYCSLPLCRILSREELVAVIGHELGHFKGQDTQFSEHFYPIYRGTETSLASLQAVGGEGAAAIALLPAMAVFSYFLESFAVAESRLSRQRELAADEAGASVTSPRAIATALVKLHAFSGVWNPLQDAAVSQLREGKAFVNVSRTYAEAVGHGASPAALEGLDQGHLSHPTDSHPPLSERLESLRLTINDVATDALAVAPAEPAIREIRDAEKHEEEISDAYQAILARHLGIPLKTADPADPEDADGSKG